VLFAGKQHFDVGGVERDTDQVACRLVAAGHSVEVLASPRRGLANARRGVAPELQRVSGYEYPAWAAYGLPPDVALREMTRRFHPDAVVVNAAGSWWHDWTRALVGAAAGLVPCVFYIRDREAVALLSEPGIRPDAVWTVADSHTDAVRGTTTHEAITIPSVIEPDLYRVEPTGEVVLYVNPIKTKGVRTAITLAASRPDIPFVFLRSYGLRSSYLQELERMAATLGNVELAGPLPDPREFYRRARLLLAPYDDFGRPRVIAEAQLSGIPVLALDEAGNREACGPGGILVTRDAPFSAWVDALGRMWDDPEEHRRLSVAALAHSQRPEIDPDVVVASMVAELGTTIERVRQHRERRRVGVHGRRPLVSVVMPVRNAAATIDQQLEALAGQTYSGEWELLISDNGCTDDSRARAISWSGGLPAPIRIIDASERRGVAHARNAAIRAARGDYILICDADDVVSPEWMERMVEALDRHDIVTGPLELRRFNEPRQYEWTGDADAVGLHVGYGFRQHASGGNLGVRRDVAVHLAGFDEQMRRAEDLDWSWRAQYSGYDIAFEPLAVIHYRMRSDWRHLAAARFRGGLTAPLLYRRHRRRGMRADSKAEVVTSWRWLVVNAPLVWKAPDARHQWISHAAHRAGRVVGSLRHRTRYL
jgi:glycosyltransferase involved in cell wall biosynthesis